MNPPPKIVVHPASEPLTPPATPDRPVDDQTVSNLATGKQHNKRQVAEKPDAGLLTPPSRPRRTRRSHEQETPHQHIESPTKQQQQQQHVTSPPQHPVPPTPSEEQQARRLERRAAMHLDPTYIANSERKRVVRERDSAARKERIERITRIIPRDANDALSRERQGMRTLTFPEVFGEHKKDRKEDFGPRGRPASASAAFVPKPNFGNPPGEWWLARREWLGFLMRREAVWGGSEACEDGDGDVGGEGGGEGEAET
jgi:hypothetical protein